MRFCWLPSLSRHFFLLLPVATFFVSGPALLAQGHGSLAGMVRDSAGAWISGAEITVAGSATRAYTDASGAFRLDRVPAGDVRMQIRRLGYAPGSIEVRIAANERATVDVRLAALPYTLKPVAVRERREVYDSRLAGFHARRERGVGHFFTREHLDRLSYRLVDVLREVPGTRIRAMRGTGRTVTMRGSCPALIVIDGFPASAGTFDLDMIDLAGYEAVEVYSSASSVPVELMAPRGIDRCGVIALWSRPARRRNVTAGTNRPGGEVRRMLESGAVHSAEAVEQQAELIGALAPVYPEALWNGGIGGRVVVEFVVDGRGEIEFGTLATVASTHADFTAAVRAALPEARFRPALLRGRSVRQAVQLPVEFEIPNLSNGP